MEANPGVPVANVEYMYAAGVQRLCNGSAGHDCAAATAEGCGDDPSKVEKGHCADLGVMRKAMWGFYMALSSSAWRASPPTRTCGHAMRVLYVKRSSSWDPGTTHDSQVCAIVDATHLRRFVPGLRPERSESLLRLNWARGRAERARGGTTLVSHHIQG